MKTVALALAAAIAPLAATSAIAAEPAPATAPAKYSSESDMGTLLDNPATRAVLEKYIAPMINNPQIDAARAMTLKQLQGYAADALPEETLAKIDADLAKIPAK